MAIVSGWIIISNILNQHSKKYKYIAKYALKKNNNKKTNNAMNIKKNCEKKSSLYDDASYKPLLEEAKKFKHEKRVSEKKTFLLF